MVLHGYLCAMHGYHTMVFQKSHSPSNPPNYSELKKKIKGLR